MGVKTGVTPISLGNGRWKVRVCCGYGAQGKKKMTSRTFRTDPKKAESVQFAEACLYRDKLRIEFEEGKLTHSQAVTLKAYAEQWLESYCEEKQLAKGTIADYKSMLRQRVIPQLGNLKMRDIRPEDIKRFMTALRKDKAHLSGTTRRKYHNMLHLIFKTAMREQVVSINPLDYLDPPAKDTRERPVYSPEEARNLVEALNEAPAKWRACILLLLDAGIRRGECLGLEWRDINMKTGAVKISRSWAYAQGYGHHLKEPKTKQSCRTIFVSPQTISALQQWKAEQAQIQLAVGAEWKKTGAVFTQENGERMHLDSPANWFERFLKRNGLPKLNIHGLRHTGASLLISQGEDIVSVSKRLGHGQVSTTLDIYAHAYEEGSRRASEKMGELLYGEKA